jgi:hypothetical protein
MWTMLSLGSTLPQFSRSQSIALLPIANGCRCFQRGMCKRGLPFGHGLRFHRIHGIIKGATHMTSRFPEVHFGFPVRPSRVSGGMAVVRCPGKMVAKESVKLRRKHLRETISSSHSQGKVYKAQVTNISALISRNCEHDLPLIRNLLLRNEEMRSKLQETRSIRSDAGDVLHPLSQICSPSTCRLQTPWLLLQDGWRCISFAPTIARLGRSGLVGIWALDILQGSQ